MSAPRFRPVQRAVDRARLAAYDARGILKVGTPASGIHPVASALLDRFRNRHPDVRLEIYPASGPQSLEGLAHRTLDAAIVLAPFEAYQGLRYRALGTTEMLIAVPEGHPLTEREWISRSDLLREPFLDWPRSMNPILVDHLRELLFGPDQHPRRVEMVEVTEANRVLLVGEGRGITATIFPSISGLNLPRVAFRPEEPPTPHIEYGLAWPEQAASPFAPHLVDLARAMAG